MTADWNMQTNLKNKPNAQGTLFSGGKAQMDPAKRYPRGYTPERMREVTSTVQFPDDHYSHEVGRDYYNRANAMQNVARSTVPASHLEGLTLKVLPSKGALIGGGAGVYEDDKRTAKVLQHSSGTATVIHEIGHHVSSKSNADSYGAGTPRERGHEEGFADRYADEHFRLDPSSKKKLLPDSRRGLTNYEPTGLQTRDRNGRQRGGDFTKGYNAARPMHTRVPNETDLGNARAVAGMNAHLQRQDAAPTLPGL